MNVPALITRSIMGQMLLAGIVFIAGWESLLRDRVPASWQGALPAMGVLAICLLVVVAHAARIRRLARAIDPQPDEQGLQPLTEAGLPAEMLPLVRGLNHRIARVADIGERQRFFLSAAAHEMRTPLTVVRTRLEQLEDSALKDQLVTDARRLNRLVNDLLTLMSIRGRERVLKPVDLAHCCRRVIDALDSVAATRAVRVKLAITGSQPDIVGDAGLLQVGITNLVQNAIAYSPIGGRVTIELDGETRLTVSDEGPGIPDDQAEALFDPFVRLSSKPGGYGLGLTIVRAVAEVHGATVRAGNVAGGGAKFVIDFKPR